MRGRKRLTGRRTRPMTSRNARNTSASRAAARKMHPVYQLRRRSVAGLAPPELLVEVEVAAVKGAHAGIEWIGPDALDPLDSASA